MKVIIQDLVKKLNNENEQELPPNCSIRFENNGRSYTIGFNYDGELELYLTSNDSQLVIKPIVSNQIKLI